MFSLLKLESLANLLQITAKRSKVILPLRKGILLQKKGILQLWPHNRTGFKVVPLRIHFIVINMIDSKQSAS